MATQHMVRLMALVPAARQNAINTWIHNNLDPNGGNWLTAGLSATSNAPATHYIFNAALTVPQFTQIANQLLTLASISLPADWNTRNITQKFSWFQSQYAGIRSATGIRLRVFRNDGAWDNPQDELTAAGLKPITSQLA